MQRKIRVLLADDHILIREGFKTLLSKSEVIEIAGEAENGRELISLVPEILPDVVLVDITMPIINGINAVQQLSNQHPGIAFIILSMHEEREYVLRALQAGARGYLLKDIEKAELERAIQIVYNGGKYFSPIAAAILADTISTPVAAAQPDITPREKEVLGLVAQGNSSKQIADKLKISIRTVESHRINMLKKYNVSNTAELINRAVQLRLIDQIQ